MIPGTGSETLDVVLQFALVTGMVVLIVLLIKNHFGGR